MNRFWAAPLLLARQLAACPTSHGAERTAPLPQQIQTMIAAGQETQAIQALQNVLENHPKSAVAWYLLAEAYDAQNNEQGAASALNMALSRRRACPLPTRSRWRPCRGITRRTPPPGRKSGGGATAAILVIGGLILLFMLMRVLPSRNQAARYNGYLFPARLRHAPLWVWLRPAGRWRRAWQRSRSWVASPPPTCGP